MKKKFLVSMMFLALLLCLASMAMAKDYDNSAYYDVSWDTAVISEDTEGYISTVENTWDKPMWVYDADEEKHEYSKNSKLIYDYCITAGGFPQGALVWYAWVDSNGQWHGHVYGKPTVTNSITGEDVAVTKWEVKFRNDTQDHGFPSLAFGDWSVSGSGPLINSETVSPAAVSVTRATLIQRNMYNARKSRGFSTLVISFPLL